MLYKNAYKQLCSLSATFLLIFFLSANFYGAPGDLDLSFGDGGKIFMPINYVPSRVQIQPDGKIVTLISDYFGAGYSVFARRNADGSPDTTFGDGGYTSTAYYGIVFDFVIQPDGKLVGVGETYAGEAGNFAVFRFNSNGTPDAGFGTNGIVTPPFTYSPRTAGMGVALQQDGKIVAKGFADTFQGRHFLLVRCNSDGTLDTSFGTNGIVDETVENHGDEKILVQPDGKLIVDGSGFIARYNSNGTPDNSFGTNGRVNTPANNMELQSDLKIVVIAYRSQSPSIIKRFNSDGIADTSFGINGVVSITELEVSAYQGTRAFAIQRNDKIIVAGSLNGTFAISRRNPDGSIDTIFGTNGLVITPLGNNNEYNRISALTLQPNGKIVAAGYFWNGSNGYATLVRYLSDPVNASFDFDGDGRADISVFRPSDRVWYLNQSTAGFSATQFGISTDKITPADFDGDGKTDISVYRDGTWYWLKSSDNSFNARQFGIASDIPVPADYTGDGRAEIAVYRGGVWWTLNLINEQANASQFGVSTDRPVPADYDGDGRADQAVYRNGEWHLNRSTQGYTVVSFGLATDKPVVGDYDGDGKADQAVYRDGTWYLMQSSQGFAAFPFGIATDIPAPADYDGDGKTDAAVFRDGVWYLRQSTSGISIQQFGLTGDKPIPSAFLLP